MIAAYLMSFTAMCFAALSAITLINWVNRFDPPSTTTRADTREHATAA